MIDEKPIQAVDVAMVVDPRFSGGTISALETDVRAFAALGARVGLLLVRSHFLDDARDKPNPKIDELLSLDHVVALTPGTRSHAQCVFFHHPLPFFYGVEQGAHLTSNVSVVVVHHLPFRGDGSLEFDPLRVVRLIRQSFGLTPMLAPVSKSVRRQLRSFLPLVRLTTDDWPNLFATELFRPQRLKFAEERVLIGRHGRVDPLKWPDSRDEIERSLPSGPGRHVRVMGCPADHLDGLGVDTTDWEILTYNAEPVTEFLDGLDVFSYFHSSRINESFGRTAAEAALMGVVCVLDPRLKPNFGDVGIYCQPHEVTNVVTRLAADPVDARRHAARAREAIVRLYDVASLERRWRGLLRDAGDAGRSGDKHSSPLTTVRKMIGLYRRRAASGF